MDNMGQRVDCKKLHKIYSTSVHWVDLWFMVFIFIIVVEKKIGSLQLTWSGLILELQPFPFFLRVMCFDEGLNHLKIQYVCMEGI